MTDERFADNLSRWLNEEAAHRVPDHFGELNAQIAETPQRRRWSSLERWLPMQGTLRVASPPRLSWMLLIALAIVAAVAIVVLGVAGQRKVPHFGAQANGQLAFIDGNELKVAAADGSGIKVAATLPSGVESIGFSPDGTHLAYRTTGSPPTIVVTAADGSGPVVVSGGATVAEAAQIATRGPFVWSPDSRRLAFTVAVGDGIRAIDVVDADGSNLTSLISDKAAPAIDRFDPTWSPDGQWISFFSTDVQHSIAINVVHPGGSDQRRLATSPVDSEYVELSWAPDPSQVRFAFVSGGELKIFDLATGNETNVGEGFWASWSPDARRIAWWDAPVSEPTEAGVGGIRLAMVDSVLAGRPSPVRLFAGVNNNSCFAQIAAVGICSPAAWSPDSRWVFGPDPTGSSIVFGTVDEPRIVRTIALDRAVDLSGGPQGSVAWQAIAP